MNSSIGVVSGVIEIRRPDGSLKAAIPFVGQTSLTESELRSRLFPEETNGTDSPESRSTGDC